MLGCVFGLATLCSGEFRGLWVDAFHPGFHSADEVRQLVADARAGHFNALLVEVRKRGDAYYQSRFEPKAADVDPAFDPLAELLAQAHDNHAGPRLEVHAWMVTYNVWNRTNELPPQPDHPYRLHPDWLTESFAGTNWDGANYAFDPGHPAVQEHTYQIAMDLISRYEIDGLHWDYVRYAGPEWGYNRVAVERFNEQSGTAGRPAADDPAWLQWRRDQVTGLVRRVYLSALALKPAVKLSAATITWTPSPTNAAHWYHTAPFACVLQDWRSWMEEGILDLNLPMAYFRHEQNGVDWQNWSAFAKEHRANRHLALGVGAYLNGLSNSLAQIESTRAGTATARPADGVACYSYLSLGKNRLPRSTFLDALTRSGRSGARADPLFATLETPLPMSWKTTDRPTALMGIVRDAKTGTALARATIETCITNTAGLETDANGFYGRFVDLEGPVSLTVLARGYASEQRTVDLRRGEVAMADFALTAAVADPAPAPELPAAAGPTNLPSIGWPAHRPTAGQGPRDARPDDGAPNQTATTNTTELSLPPAP